jgi:DNA-binding protein YbaB
MNGTDVDSAVHCILESRDECVATASDGVTQTVAGIVSVTVDPTLRLSSVRLLDDSIDARTRESIEKGIVQAVNRAMVRVVRSSPDASTQWYEAGEWQATMAQLFSRGGAA